jgi:hypothetical protein
MPEEPKVTTRGLVDFDMGPLRRFRGKLDSMPTEPQTFQGPEGKPSKPSTRINLNFSSIEVIETTEPYHFPTYVVQMTLSNRKKSRWGVLSESFNAIVDSQYTPEQLDPSNPAYIKPSDRMDIAECVGKMFGMVLADGEDGRPDMPTLFDGRANEDKPTPAWMVYEVEGIGVAGGQGISASDLAKGMLDGKTLAQFNKEALANAIIRADTALFSSISLPVSSPGSFANALVQAGEFTKDKSGVYHKVQ